MFFCDLLQRPHTDPAVTEAQAKLMATFGLDTIKRLPVTLKIHGNLLGTAGSAARLLSNVLCPFVLAKKRGAQNIQ